MTAVDLAHDDAGEGPVVVLIHGHPFNQSMWTPQLAALRDSFRVIAPDLCGYGDSPITPGTMPMAQLAADVRHLLDAKGIATGALVGLSMGGLVVMELTAAQPHRWWAYGFIATTAQRVTAEEQQARRASARTMQEQGMRPVAEQMADRLFGPDPSAELTATVMGMMLATSPAGAAAAVRGRAEHRPPAEHLWNRAACRPAIRSLPMSAVDGDRPGGSERHASDPTLRPAGQAARLPAIPADEQRDDEVPEASTVNDAAVAAYRLSVQAGNPLSERRLAHMFGRTSRRWARARIADAQQASSIQESGAPAMA